jgi:hypothetical protein
LRDQAIIEIKNPDNRNAGPMFLGLSLLQSMTSMEIDLSFAKIDSQDLTDISLYAPNFDGSPFRATNLYGASLPNATFHGSSFEGTNFPAAKLRFAQFQDATFTGPASFRSADLYGVAFDRAQLCKVDFSKAGLVNATFWKASFPKQQEKFLANFPNSPWWVATGWTKEQLQWLQNAPFNPKEIAATKPFRDQIGRYESIVNVVGAAIRRDEFALAIGRNNLAWQLAIWGVCMQQCPGIPDAESEANSAVDLITGLLNRAEERAEENVKNRFRQKLATMLDTRGYIRLQKGSLEAAKSDLAQAVQVGRNAPDGGTLFHYSVALLAHKQIGEATEILKRSLEEQGYRPSHELRNLWHYLGASTGEYNRLLLQRIETMSLKPDPEKPCPD